MKKLFYIKIKNIAAALLLLFVASCASISIEQMKKEAENFKLPKLPDKKSAIVYVVRPSNLGPIIRFNVFLDNKNDLSEMGYTRGKNYIYFKVEPGVHKILSKAENWAEVTIDAKENNTYFIEQVPSMGFIMARNSLKLVDESYGKYCVKTLGMGTIKRFD